MVVVRESPHSKVSPNKSKTQWPPRSPFQALLSSPSGRRKWQDQRNVRERETSPSPVKRVLGKAIDLDAPEVDANDGSEDEDGDEDEEMLQLKLQAIQAKLKLKKLQKSKKEGTASEGNPRNLSRAESSLPSSPGKPTQACRPRHDPVQSNVEVPLSPTKPRNPLKEPVSPARKRLGLDKPAKAQDVSLKRTRDGTQIQHINHIRQQAEDESSRSKPVSFSERLNQNRADSQAKLEKHDRIERSRSKGFGNSRPPPSTNGSQSSGLNVRATPNNTNETKRPSSAYQAYTTREVDHEADVARSASTRSSRAERKARPGANDRLTANPSTSNGNHINGNGVSDAPLQESGESSPGFDDFSELHLSKRLLSHVDVARAMENKEIYTLPRLLKEVKAPHYDPPDCENDYVLFAVLASKSNPFDQKSNHRTSDENKAQEDADGPRNKFMVFHLCDLKWEVDCFLFGSAFDQFWKLTPGTLLAVLNPGIMPPKGNQNSGRFSLKLGSSEDCVMEIGVARDLGYCTSIKKDGTRCEQWVDKRSTEICEFHLNLEIDRNRKHRMEVNGMWRGHAEGANKHGEKGKWIKSQAGKEGAWDHRVGKEKKGQGGSYHREFGRLYSIPGGGGGKSAANLLDAEDTGALHDMTKEEASRKRIAAAQRERDLAKKLGEMGNSVGAEYLRAKTTGTSNRAATEFSSAETRALFEKPSASELGLLGKKASDQHLSPAKDRKRHFGLGAISSAGHEAMGWGGARKAGLLQPKENLRLGSPEKGQTKLLDARPGIVRARSEDGSLSPKKRARFMLEIKGLREPGRESLGEDLGTLCADDVAEDDGLDIV